MTPLAAVVLAHADPGHLRRLVDALDDVPVFLHCDARTDAATFAAMVTGLPRRVTVCERRATTLASWSLVDAEIAALREALGRTRARHIAVLSGADYPLVSMQALLDELALWEGRSYFWNVRLPFRQWDTPRHRDGGRWRFEHRFLRRHDQVLFWRAIPLRWPVRRAVPAELDLRASSQWKIYSREHVEILLHAVDTRPDLMRFWSSTLVPEESFAASTLGSPALAGAAALQPCAAQAWHMEWPTGVAHHPRWLRTQDFDKLRQARWAPSPDPIAATEWFGHDEWFGQAETPTRKLFARKFGSGIDTDVLDLIDTQLRR